MASILTAMIRVQPFDVHPVLSVHPCHKCFVSIKGLILGAKQIKSGKMGVVVGESDIVLAATQAGYR